MNDMRRSILWVVFAFSLIMLWDKWQIHNGKPATFFPDPQAQTATQTATPSPAASAQTAVDLGVPASSAAAAIDAAIPADTTVAASAAIPTSASAPA